MKEPIYYYFYTAKECILKDNSLEMKGILKYSVMMCYVNRTVESKLHPLLVIYNLEYIVESRSDAFLGMILCL
jgi:hypothetical protein